MNEVAATPTQREQSVLASNYINAQTLIEILPFRSISHGIKKVQREKLFNETSGIPILHYPQLFGAEMGNSRISPH